MELEKTIIRKIRRKLIGFRLRPIRVFCFHQVSEEFKPETMLEGDWLQTEAFKRIILSLKGHYTFIGIQDASRHISNDFIRLKKYAVLTADDGWESVLNILPWLADQQLPIVLFLNSAYLDGAVFRERETERYLMRSDLDSIAEKYPNVSFGLHGWCHDDVTKQSENEFRDNVKRSIRSLEYYKNYVPFFAYPWGRQNSMNKRVLDAYKLIPVFMDGQKNYNGSNGIHRELLTEDCI